MRERRSSERTFGGRCGGFVPTPPGFGRFAPLPIGGNFCEQTAKRGCSSPLDQSRPLKFFFSIIISCIIS